MSDFFNGIAWAFSLGPWWAYAFGLVSCIAASLLIVWVALIRPEQRYSRKIPAKNGDPPC